jgi:ABC-type nitrate/sulfonate/bicarbonate transport system substrate-binding protein
MLLATAALLVGACAAPPAPPKLVPVSIVLGANLGHLPILVGAEKGLFAKHGIDLQLKVVNNGDQMVAAMRGNEVELGDMSVTTFIKARHDGDAWQVVGLIMNDATRSNADEALAIISKQGSGIRPGRIEDLKGRKVAVQLGQTPHEYLKIAAAKAGLGENDIVIVNTPQSPVLVELLRDGKVDAVASLEPLNSLVMRDVPGAYEVQRGGGYLSYLMITTARVPTIVNQTELIERFAAGLAAATQYTRQNRAEAVKIFAARIPNQNVEALTSGIKHISYDPRMSAATDRAFEAAQTEVLSQSSMKGKAPMPLNALLFRDAIVKAQSQFPQYFSDLPKL